MERFREWLVRLWAAFRPSRSDADLEEELRLHLELAAMHQEPGSRAAVIRSGGLAQSMEHLRDQRGLPWLDALGRDARDAWRAIRRNQGFAVVATSTLGAALALCLGVLTIANAFLVRPLPYRTADRLHAVVLAEPGQTLPTGLDDLDWPSLEPVIDDHIAWDLDVFFLLGGSYPEPAPGAWVTPGFVRALGVRAERGRALQPADFKARGPTPVMISHRLWTTRYGRDPDIVGRGFKAYVSDRPDEAETFTIVGVLPADFWHVNIYTEVFAPLRAPAYPYLVTVRSGVDPRLAEERIAALVRSQKPSLPEDWRARLVPFQSRYSEEMRPLLNAVAASAVLVLLIAAANTAVLLLVRSVRRRHEIAIRLAVGASRSRLTQLLGLEAAFLATGATVVGLAGSSLLTRALAPIIEERLGRRLPGGVSALALDGTLTIVALVAAALLTLGLTLAPLVTVWSTSVGTALKAAGRNVTDGRAAQRVRSVLIVGEIAAALALLVGSALMIQSAVRMLHVDPGLDVDGVVMTNIGLRPRSYPDPVRRAQFFERLLERLDERTGPGGAALSDAWPLQTPRPRRVERAGDDPAAVEAGISGVTAGYFATLGLDFRDGRSFTAEDRVGGEPVVVVSESLARRLWPDGRAVGQTLMVPKDDAHDAAAAGLPRVVVGVVEDVTLVGYDDGRVQDSASPFQAYVPLLQDAGRFAFAYARHVSHAPDTVRDAAVALDREASVMPPRNLDTMFDEMRNGSRQLAWLLSAFAVFAAVLALLGVYSVMAYGVRQREREIGVRLVVGAGPRMVTRAFVREGSVMLACGLAVGLLGAIALGQALRNQLFGVDPIEPGTLAAGSAIFAASGLLAIWWPARRAARVDPARVLKDE